MNLQVRDDSKREWARKANLYAPWSLFEIFFKFARLLRRLFLSIVSVTHAVYCHVNVLSSHVMLLTVRDLQLIGSKMNQLSAKFRTHDAILTDPWGVGSLNNHAVLHRSKNRLGIMFMERGSCMRDSLSYLIPSWITANFWSLVQSNSYLSVSNRPLGLPEGSATKIQN